MTFAEKLISWHEENLREHPWKETNDPYKIWLSEIILQQTRVAQGTPYYLRFIHAFPTLKSLANAKIEAVLKVWEGLGYYSRARNLHHAANTILTQFNGVFPDRYEDILSLKGIGPYTAAAIASFAYKLPYAVVDGNVLRVLSRYYAVTQPVDQRKTYTLLQSKAQKLLPPEAPDLFNQAIMDMGALVCTPHNPLCSTCPLSDECLALKLDLTKEIPFKAKKLIRKIRHFHYLVMLNNRHVYLHQRGENDIWKGMFEFPLLEGDGSDEISRDDIFKFARKLLPGRTAINISDTHNFTQHLTHQTIHFTFWKLEVSASDNIMQYFKSPVESLPDFAFPKTIKKYIGDHLI